MSRTSSSSRSLVSGLAALAIAPLAACDNPVDTSENVLPWVSEADVPGDTSADTTPSDGADADEGACDCLTVGKWYRFDTLALTSIDNAEHPVIPTLNGLWQADIDALELTIMIEVTEVSASEVKTRVVNGARIDGSQTICALDATAVEVVFPRTGCTLATSNPSAFNVYAGTLDFPKNCSTTLPVKHAIPVAGARLSGTLSDDCGAILTGKVPAGALGQDELGKICTCLLLPGSAAEECGALEPGFSETVCVGCNANYQSLSQLLTAFGEVSWSCQTEGGAPAACLTADFTAKAMDTTPASCE
jgi:hypothetical protein